ncbi:MAG: nitrogen regulation protein NR(II) [Planctomycetota bacterium]
MEVRGVVLAVVLLLAVLLGLGVHLGSTGRQLLVEAERARRQNELEACAAALGERLERLQEVVRRVAGAESLERLSGDGPRADAEDAQRKLDELLAEIARDPAVLRVAVLPLGFGGPLAGYDAAGEPAPSLLAPEGGVSDLVARASGESPRRMLLGLSAAGDAPRFEAAWRTGRGWVIHAVVDARAPLQRVASEARGAWALVGGEQPLWPPGAPLPFVPRPGPAGDRTRVEGDHLVSVAQVAGGELPWRLLVKAPLTRGLSGASQAALALAALVGALAVGLGIYGARSASLGESLRHSERQERELQGTFDAITDPLLVLDRELRVVRGNRAGAVPRGEDYAVALARRGLDDPEAELAAVRGVVARGEPRVAELSAGGRVLEVAQFPVFGPDLSVAGVVEHLRDVTQTKALQAQLVQSDKLSTLGEMAAGIAHEVNNPIGVISMFAQLLSEELGELREGGAGLAEGVDSALEKVQTIEEQAGNVGEIVKGLLRFARKSEGTKQRLDARVAVDRALAIVEHQRLLRDVELERETPAPAWVLGDEGQLAQVVLNLVVNGCHAMGGEGRLRLAVHPPGPDRPAAAGRAFGTVPDGGERVHLVVADSGSGIPADKLERIFEPFFTTKVAGEGTGLGLSVGFAIIRDHQGCIWVDTREGEGTTFTIDLPAAPEEDAG